MKQSKEIYFHVGTGKTGTTYLQYKVFPKFKGIYYIQRTKYKKSKKIIAKTNYEKYLISREFDQQLEDEIRWFSRDYPDTTPIIVFRRHDSYIASQYRRFVKNGFTGNFKDFFDLENDNGFFKKKDLDYFSQIKLLEKYFTKKPIVLFYEDFKEDPINFIKTLSDKIGASFNPSDIDLRRKHTSYSEKQLKGIKHFGKYINLKKRRIFKNGILHLLWRLYLGSIRYTILYAYKILPEPKEYRGIPLIQPEELEAVRKYYEKDWEKCHRYVKGS